MHLAIGTLLHQLYTFEEPPHIQRRNTAIMLGILVPFVIYHCVADEFILHVLLFFCMSWIVAFRTRYHIARRIKENKHRDMIRGLVTFATRTALIAYAIWNVDVHFCPTVTKVKKSIGPLSFLLELHGWWHILTAISSYTFMAVIEFLLSPENVDSYGVGFTWPVKAVFLDVAPKREQTESTISNSHIKGT